MQTVAQTVALKPPSLCPPNAPRETGGRFGVLDPKVLLPDTILETRKRVLDLVGGVDPSFRDATRVPAALGLSTYIYRRMQIWTRSYEFGGQAYKRCTTFIQECRISFFQVIVASDAGPMLLQGRMMHARARLYTLITMKDPEPPPPPPRQPVLEDDGQKKPVAAPLPDKTDEQDPLRPRKRLMGLAEDVFMETEPQLNLEMHQLERDPDFSAPSVPEPTVPPDSGDRSGESPRIASESPPVAPAGNTAARD